MKKIILVLLLALLPFAAHAQDARAEKAIAAMIAPGNPGCALTETANVSVSFNSIEKDIGVASTIFESKVDEIKNAAKEIKLEKLDVQSMNYNLYPYNAGGMGSAMQWQLNGSVSFQVVPPAKAKDLVVLLVKKGFQPNLSVNAYRSGTCQ